MTLPTGTVTFLFTDIQGSTMLWQKHPTTMPDALARHHAILRQAIETHNGYVFQIVGDAFCAAFPTACDGLRAALAAQRALHSESWDETGAICVRMALHTGVAELRAGDYTSGEYVSGITLSRTARLLSAGHGGQVLISDATRLLVENDLPTDVTVRDLGEHRLKDLERPEHIYQLVIPDLPSDFPPLKTLGAFPNNLPIQLTSFIGRIQDLAEIERLIDHARLVTLTGAGGCGKSRLALQVAAKVMDNFPNGIWLIELAPLTDATLIPQSIATLLGLQEQAQRNFLTIVIDYLREKTTLLVLDNCEHLIGACAKLVVTLLQACPRLKILTTSREALGVAGETTYRVPSLEVPDLGHLPAIDALTQYEAVQLFVERASNVLPAFTITPHNAPIIAQICCRLDGIPLAIELAAARANVLSIEQIAQRLDDRFKLLTGGSRTALPRQQTLRALIDWSYDLLSQEERQLFWRLSVFAGGFSLEAVEAVCGDDTLDLLASLVTKSLVVAEPQNDVPRYRMLETLRQYARERLVASGEAEQIRTRHLDYFCKLAEEADSELKGPHQLAWLDRLETEHDNLRTALEWSVGEGRVEKGLRLASGVMMFWRIHSYYSEGRERLEKLLAQPEAAPRTLTRAGALRAVAAMSAGLGDSEARRQYLEELIPIAREQGVVGKKLLALGIAMLAVGTPWSPISDKSTLEEALAIARSTNDQWVCAFVLSIIGSLSLDRHDYTGARHALEESLALFESCGGKFAVSSSTSSLGDMYFWEGNLKQARQYYEQTLSLLQETKSRDLISWMLYALGAVARSEGDYVLAKNYCDEALKTIQDVGNRDVITLVSAGMGFVMLHENRLNETRSLFNTATRLVRETRNKATAILALLGVACLATVENQSKRATQLFAVITPLLESASRSCITPADQAECKRCLALAREQLDEAEFNAAWEEGSKMTLEQAVGYALEDKPDNSANDSSDR